LLTPPRRQRSKRSSGSPIFAIAEDADRVPAQKKEEA
jgi:hypothetical protein